MTTAAQLSENSHQGFAGLKAALCLGSMEAKSNTASGMPVCLWQNCTGSRSSGKERDTETGLDYFMARYFSSAQGRFTSPDPLLASARLTDPQTWNRYTYVRNDPVNNIDPDGMDWINASVFQGLRNNFLTGDMFNDWFRQAMGITTINDFSGAASLPGYSGPDPALIAYLAEVDNGQENLRKIEQAEKEKAKKAEASPQGTVTIVEGSKVVTGKPENGCSEVVIKGDATYYNLVGRKTASGQVFNPNSSNAAMYRCGVIKMGDTVTVQLQSEPSKSVTVIVNDTGPFLRGSDGRAIYPLQPDPNIVIDLTPAAFRDLAGSTAVGRVPVVVTRGCPVP